MTDTIWKNGLVCTFLYLHVGLQWGKGPFKHRKEDLNPKSQSFSLYRLLQNTNPSLSPGVPCQLLCSQSQHTSLTAAANLEEWSRMYYWFGCKAHNFQGSVGTTSAVAHMLLTTHLSLKETDRLSSTQTHTPTLPPSYTKSIRRHSPFLPFKSPLSSDIRQLPHFSMRFLNFFLASPFLWFYFNKSLISLQCFISQPHKMLQKNILNAS